MAAIHASADVQHAQIATLISNLPADDPVLSLPAIFSTKTPKSITSGERAPKRRKYDDRRINGLKSANDFDENKSAVLARVILDLQLTTASKAQFASEPLLETLEVFLESFSRTTANQFSISLRNLGDLTLGLDLIATSAPDALKSMKPHLQTISTLHGGSAKNKVPNYAGASFCRCVLSCLDTEQDQEAFRLVAEIRWTFGFSVVEGMGPKSPYMGRDLEILSKYFPGDLSQENAPWSLSDFYDSVHVPDNDMKVSPRIERSLPGTQLYPFQKRAVDWLLKREGVAYSNSGHELVATGPSSTLPVSFQTVQDAGGRTVHISHLRGMVISDPNTIHDSARILRGGILAEEMGLGKTVELVALMCHHKRDIPRGDVFDTYTGFTVKPSGATLIISPPSILQQWKDELDAHAPFLKVRHYEGLPAPSAPKRKHSQATVESLLDYDIVLTTYNVLSREIHYTKPPPDRSLRHQKQHPPRKSPLVQISWWRVCLDEAQMVENGVSQAATVARIIPRCNAWAVSGTPLRKDIQDLRGLLTFLRYEPFAGCNPVWNRLDKASFRSIFGHIALRHTKDKIRGELQLPPQKRVVITVPFTAIEEQNYSHMISQMCADCGLSPEGCPLDEDRIIDNFHTRERMREWLVRLRQTCLHAHVGTRNRKALGAKNGPLRTVHQVLEVMIEQNDTLVKSDAREYILTILRRGHIRGNAKNDEFRSERASYFYQEALKEVQEYVKTCREELAQEIKKVGAPAIDLNQDLDEDDREGQNLGRVPTIRKSLRSFLELEHACKFFIGTTYYQLKSDETLTESDSEKFHLLEKLETEWYDEAKTIRKEILKETQSKALRQMNRIRSKKPFHQLAQIADLPSLGGIEGKKILDVMDYVCDILNAQATQLEQWRQRIVDILLLPLVDEDDKETTGEEYEDSTKAQDELYVYVMGLRTLVADRVAAVNGLSHDSLLIEHEIKEAEKQALEKQGHAPELVVEIAAAHRKLKPKEGDGSLKGVVSGVRSLMSALQWKADAGDERAAAELTIVQKQFSTIQKLAAGQAKIIVELEKEQDLFRAAMNQRLEFYRQLQIISDSVAPWKEELDPVFDESAFDAQSAKETQIKRRLIDNQKKHNYLINLRDENQKTADKQECIICKDVFEIGVLTTCGHKYCKECINLWWRQHRSCPLCKKKLRSNDLADIDFKPNAMKAQEELSANPSQASTPSLSNTSIYSDMSDFTMKEIKMIDLDGSYGSKIDMIARHLIWIRQNDTGAKSIIFSQFGDFLEVLGDALEKWAIGCSSSSDKNGILKFKADPKVECFLLDAKSDSSGLNLVNATYVFLCEPLINPAIELQAIARVHRIGQQRATTVFMYLVSDTVEESIYDISVARRLEHMGRDSHASSTTTAPALQENTLDAANSMELEAAPLKQLLGKKGDGEMVKAQDLWDCLFRKPRKQQNADLDDEINRHLRAEAAEKRRAQEEDSVMLDA